MATASKGLLYINMQKTCNFLGVFSTSCRRYVVRDLHKCYFPISSFSAATISYLPLPKPKGCITANFHTSQHISKDCGTVSLTFILKDGSEKTLDAPVGLSILEVAHMNGIDLEGACEASLACSTCHIILEEEVFDSIPPASETEEDLLDLAPSLTLTSRLGCQVIVTSDMDGIRIELPSMTRNFYVDGHVPSPH